MNHMGRYRLDAIQGVGAFATVWRGHDPELDVQVAVKVLADNWSHHDDVRERFLEEARLLRRLDDPRIVRVHDVGVEDGRPYFVMDFVPGGTVGDRVGAMNTQQALALAIDCARAVHALHEHDVLHRDVKPSNLLIGSDGQVLVSDLGSAKRLAEASGITVTTGTPAYMAPEQAWGRPLDARTDVYGLAVLTYELLTGRVPFGGPNRGPKERPAPTGAGAHVDQVLLHALSDRPGNRHASAADFARDLAADSLSRPTVPVWLLALLMTLGFTAAAVGTWWLA